MGLDRPGIKPPTQEQLALEAVQLTWHKKMREWILAKVPYRYQGDTNKGRDCWRGVVHPLLNLALKMFNVENAIPELVKSAQDKEGKQDIGELGIELFTDVCNRLPGGTKTRPGDVLIFLLKEHTHVALVIDDVWAAHSSENSGVCNSRISVLKKLRNFEVLRYNGPGSELFAA